MSQLTPKKLKDKISYLQGMKDKLQQSKLKIELAKELDRADVALEYSKGTITYFNNLKSFTKKELQFLKSVRLEQFEKAISDLEQQLKQFQKPKTLSEHRLFGTKTLQYEHNGLILYKIDFVSKTFFIVTVFLENRSTDMFTFTSLGKAKQKVYELFNNYILKEQVSLQVQQSKESK